MSSKSRKFRSFLRSNRRTGKALMAILGVSTLPCITPDQFERLLVKLSHKEVLE